MDAARLSRRGLIFGVIGLLAIVATLQPGATLAAPAPTLSKVHFVASVAGGPSFNVTKILAFSTPDGPPEFTYTDAKGRTIHLTQSSKTGVPSITLEKRTSKKDKALFTWFTKAQPGSPTPRKDVTIKVVDQNGTTVMTWHLVRAWPTKVSEPYVNAGETHVLVTQLTLAFEKLILTG